MTRFISGLCLSTLFLLPVSVRAAELQPFFTLKTASVNTLVGVAERIGTLAGVADAPEFREVIKSVKDVKGFDLNSIMGIAATVNEEGGISPILLLPITDIWRAEIPSNPDIFDTLRPFLVRRGADRADINSPLGTYVALQKQGYLVVVPEDLAGQLPADPKILFADLGPYTLGIKLDLEKVDFDTLEANLFGPMLFLAMMQNPEAGEQIENMIEVYRELFKEFSMISGGIVFNPQTADVELAGTMVPREGSSMAKQLAGYKPQPTIFSGFRGTPGNTVFSFGDSAAQGQIDLTNNSMMQASMKQWEFLLEGILEQIEMDDETGDTSKLAKEAIDTLKKIFDIEAKRGMGDSALSFSTDGTLMFAFDTGALAEIRKLAALVAEFVGPKIVPLATELLDIDIAASVNREYVTVENFKISSFKAPMDKVATLVPDSEPLTDLTPGVFWAVKDAGGKQAIAVAVGLDFAKTEQAFKSALEKTKTTAPVQKPTATFSIQGLGKFLQTTVYPIAEKAGAPNLGEAKKVFDILASSGNDATVTLNVDASTNKVDMSYRISGKAIAAIVAVVKAVAEAEF